MSEWYYADANRQRLGPLSGAELAQRFHQGAIRLDTLVWRDGLGEWRPLRDFTEELALHQGPAETFYATPDPGPAPAAVTAGAATYSPYAPPAAALASDDAFYAGGEVVQAGFWKRVAAYCIDSLVVGIAGGIIGAIIGGVLGAMMAIGSGDFGGGGFIAIQVVTNLVSLALSATYYAGFHASTAQATLGKMAVGIKVVRTDGTRITLARGIGRFFAAMLSGLILGIGYLMAAFTERKQGLHDIICDTLVVDKWAYTAHPEWQNRELGTVTVVILAIFGVLILGMIALVAVIAGLAFSAAN